MKPNTANPLFNSKSKKWIQYLIALVLITFFHSAFSYLIEIKGITPDLFIILVVWITLKEGRFVGLIAGFLIGLYLDIISGDVIGTNAFSKVIAAFVASNFYKENSKIQTTKNYKFILIVLLSALVHNVIYFFFYIRVSEQNYFIFYLKYGLATTAYTLFFTALVMLFQISSNRLK